jgi:hypothetical protein
MINSKNLFYYLNKNQNKVFKKKVNLHIHEDMVKSVDQVVEENE